MRTSYQYKIKPTKKQAENIDKTLEMLRYQYNYLLAQRFDWYEQNRCTIDRCPLICHIPDLKEQPNYYNQKGVHPSFYFAVRKKLSVIAFA